MSQWQDRIDEKERAMTERKSIPAATWRAWNNQIAGVCALVVLVGAYLLAPDSRLDRLERALVALGSTTAGQAIYVALAALLVAVIRWALARIPKGPK